MADPEARDGACSRSWARPGTRPCSTSTSEHSATDRYRWFTAQRREAGGEDRTIYRSRVGAGGSLARPVLRTLLRRRHGDLLRELGYEA